MGQVRCGSSCSAEMAQGAQRLGRVLRGLCAVRHVVLSAMAEEPESSGRRPFLVREKGGEGKAWGVKDPGTPVPAVRILLFVVASCGSPGEVAVCEVVHDAVGRGSFHG